MITKVGIYKEPRNKLRPWVVRWFGEYDVGKGSLCHYSKAFATKREAEIFRASKQTDLDRGGPKDKFRDMTIGDFAHRFLASKVCNRRPGTRQPYQLTLNQLMEFTGDKTPLTAITPEMADRFIATRKRVAPIGRGFSTWSRNRHLACAKTAFKAAVQWGYLTVNPFQHIRAERCVPRRWHHLKPEEFRKLLAVVEDLRWRSFYLLAYTTGARFGELFNLNWSDVDFEKGTITIQDRPATDRLPPFTVKDHESRTLLLPRVTLNALLAWQMEAPDNMPYILFTQDRWQRISAKWKLCRQGKPWKQNTKTGELEWVPWENRYMVNNICRDVRAHLRKAGVKTEVPLTIHTFRKSFGQNHADAGTPMHVLQKLMGHSSITTTREFYLKTADANEREAVARYEKVLETAGGETCVRLAYGQDSGNSPEIPSSLTPSKQNTY